MAGAEHENLSEWLVRQRVTSTGEVLRLWAEGLEARGVHLDRIFWSVAALHPQIGVWVSIWDRLHGSRDNQVSYTEAYTDNYRRSPFYAIMEEGVPRVRRRLMDPDCPRDYGVLPELDADGATDYIALPAPFLEDQLSCLGIATRAPGGFDDAGLALLEGSVPALARLLEIFVTRQTSGTICEVYLGRDPGRRVQAGSIHRGDLESVEAVVLMCDLRGFTRLSATLDAPALLALLDDYFETVGAPVLENGGEILKFIGDAVLAIFPVGDDPAGAVASALMAVDTAIEDGAALNARRRAAGLAEVHFGVGLHRGQVTYGNVGLPDRLDFTVIGPAVNLTSRVEGLCSSLGEPLVVTEAVAELAEAPLKDLGTHALKGVEGPVRVFGRG